MNAMCALITVGNLTVIAAAASTSIVNNSATAPTAEDSVFFVFYSLDSLGNPAAADSLYVVVTGPGGAITYRDSLASSDTRITSAAVAGRQLYTFADQVSALDGPGQPGPYVITLLAVNNGTNLLTPNTYPFQIISEELSDQLAAIGDSVLVGGGVIDSNRTEMGAPTDSACIADWVWNTPQTNHTTPGSFGRYLDTEVSRLGPGTGAYSYRLVTFDTSCYQTVPHVSVAVRNLMQSAMIASGATGSDGMAMFNLDADSFVAVAMAPGYEFAAFDTIIVAGPATDTLFGHRFDPGAPFSPLLCRVYGFVYGIDGRPEEGATVSACLPSGAAQYSVIIVSPFSKTTTTDSAGYFFLDLLPSDSLVPPGAEYEFTIDRTNGTVLRQRLTVPDTTAWRLTWSF